MNSKLKNVHIACASMFHDIEKITEQDWLKSYIPNESNSYMDLITYASCIAYGVEYTDEYEPNTLHYQNHCSSRLHSALALVHDNDVTKYANLKSLSPDALFFDTKTETSSKDEYNALYKDLKNNIDKIQNQDDFPLWFSHVDSALLAHTYCVPSVSPSDKQQVSLYDHSKMVAGFAVALHQYCEDKGDSVLSDLKQSDTHNPFLIIQGDFVGIQDFIFDSETETDANTAKMLRGKSFYVSLLTELASLKVLETLELPCTSKIISVAGKFTIIAGNTQQNIQKLNNISTEISQWFIDNFYGVGNIVIAYSQAHSTDFLKNNKADSNKTDKSFANLMHRLHQDLDIKKHQGHGLHKITPEFSTEYKVFSEYGACKYNSNYPAHEYKDKKPLNRVSDDYITIGKNLVKDKYIVISDKQIPNNISLKQQVFGFYITFADLQDTFLQNTTDNGIIRILDYSTPEQLDTPVFKGVANMYISGHVPTSNGTTIAFDKLSEKNLDTKNDEKYGVPALAVVKGDIDNLGMIFRKQSENGTFAGLTCLSRQIDMFFTIYLPTWLKTHETYRDCYTVFAGGDDFMLVGPWYTMHTLAQDLRTEFKRYTGNDNITFSTGVVMCHDKTPIKTMGEIGEHALEQAKAMDSKDAVTMFDIAVKWNTMDVLNQEYKDIKNLSNEIPLSTGYVYNTLQFAPMVEETNNKYFNPMWLSRHTYRTARYIKDNKIKNPNDMKIFLDILQNHKAQARIPLSLYLYKNRKYKKNGD